MSPGDRSATMTERDSLVALDALLRIRESGNGGMTAGAHAQHGSGTINPSNLMRSPANNLNSNSVQAQLAAQLSILLPSLNSTAASLYFGGASPSHALATAASPAHYQLAAAQAAAASWASHAYCHKGRAGAEGPGKLSSASVVAAGGDTTSPVISSPEIAAAGRDHSSTLHQNGSNVAIQQQQQQQQHSTPNSLIAPKIRTEKVQEALLSKPQRGRKRDDLSDKERMELTRTRNREHAKSTRVRKKARYQELLDREELYLQMHKQDELQSQRRQCIQNLLAIRQGMLMDLLNDQEESSSSSCSPSSEMQTPISAGTDQSFSLPSKDSLPDSSTSGSSTTRDDDDDDPVKFGRLLGEVVVPSFQFQALLPGGAESDADDAQTKMADWDRTMMSRLQRTFDGSNSQADVLRTLCYEIENRVDGIALSRDDGAFCRVELVVQTSDSSSHSRRRLVQSAILTVQFAPESSRLSSIRWTTLKDRSGGATAAPSSVGVETASANNSGSGSVGTNSQPPSREILGSHLIHPSFVSLEHEKTQEVETEEYHGPGMNI